MKKDWTGERLETFVNTNNSIEHLHRYAIVLDYLTNKVVVDIACGEGYGSFLMSKIAHSVIGIDIDSDTIFNAKEKYVSENLSFKIGAADSIPIEDKSIDVVVSFETIEHHDKHDEMMMEIKRILKPDGLLIISTPDKYYYTDRRGYKNKYHVKELYKEDFFNLVKKFFSKQQFLGQSYINGNSYINSQFNKNEIFTYSGDFSIIKKGDPIESIYLIAIASNRDFNSQPCSFFNGSQILNFQQEEKFIQILRNCNSYRVGNFILYPVKLLKKMFKN
ncbi:class I SAM-dependent methyltransferase [Flavobacterium nitratireducens]|uniref:class I SAM-dependent methyltransferase n=1 Tax=Flavobacterium nitratireducens TaxID=992289 RepID=UPI002414EBC9|nr:class I SAM-dependent methyltransferase [Flavobacterium nitratireducens]